MEIILIILALFFGYYILKFAIQVVLPLALLCIIVVGGMVGCEKIFGSDAKPASYSTTSSSSVKKTAKSKSYTIKETCKRMKHSPAWREYCAEKLGKKKSSTTATSATKKVVKKYTDYQRMVKRIADKDFMAARSILRYSNNISSSQKTELEKQALAQVKPIPASDHKANLYGYQLLNELNPTDYYQGKIARYSKASKKATVRVASSTTKKTTTVASTSARHSSGCNTRHTSKVAHRTTVSNAPVWVTEKRVDQALDDFYDLPESQKKLVLLTADAWIPKNCEIKIIDYRMLAGYSEIIVTEGKHIGRRVFIPNGFISKKG